jgi:hypothetical protein
MSETVTTVPSDLPPNRLYDVRLIKRRVERGDIRPADLDKWLGDLPDVAARSLPVNVPMQRNRKLGRPPVPEEPAPVASIDDIDEFIDDEDDAV